MSDAARQRRMAYMREYMRRRRAAETPAQREERLAYHRAYSRVNKRRPYPRTSERRRVEYLRRRDKHLAYQQRPDVRLRLYETRRVKYAADPSFRDEIARRNLEWRRQNPERAAANKAAWSRAHPEERAHYSAVRRVRKLGNGGTYTIQEWREKCAMFANLCAYCGEAKKLARDHKIPISRGGTDDITNIVPACRSCNSRKRDRTVTEYLGLNHQTTALGV